MEKFVHCTQPRHWAVPISEELPSVSVQSCCWPERARKPCCHGSTLTGNWSAGMGSQYQAHTYDIGHRLGGSGGWRSKWSLSCRGTTGYLQNIPTTAVEGSTDNVTAPEELEAEWEAQRRLGKMPRYMGGMPNLDPEQGVSSLAKRKCRNQYHPAQKLKDQELSWSAMKSGDVY